MLIGAADISVLNVRENVQYWAKELEKREAKEQEKEKENSTKE